jgi:hypothetical protein
VFETDTHAARIDRAQFDSHKIRLDVSKTKEAFILMPDVREALNLDTIPHHTTIQKTFDRLESRLGRLFLTKTVHGFYLSGHAGIDATGFERSVASRNYTQRTKMKLNALKTAILLMLNTR